MATPPGLQNGILIPRLETELGPQQWKHQVPTTGPPGNSQGYCFFSKDIILNNHNTVITLRESNIVNNTTIRL